MNIRNIRQAIRTRWIGPTNTKGSRIQASCEARTIYVECEHALNMDENHAAAARALANRLEWGWSDRMMAGVHKGDYYWIFSE